jgi:hypothetical protein
MGEDVSHADNYNACKGPQDQGRLPISRRRFNYYRPSLDKARAYQTEPRAPAHPNSYHGVGAICCWAGRATMTHQPKIESGIPIPWLPTLSYYRSALVTMKEGDSFTCPKRDRDLVRRAAVSARCDIHLGTEGDDLRVWVTVPAGDSDPPVSAWRSSIECTWEGTASELAGSVHIEPRRLGKILVRMSQDENSGVSVAKFDRKRGHTYRVIPPAK